MGYIRLAIVAIVLVLMLIISLPFLLINLIVGLFSMKARDRLTMLAMHIVFSVVLILSGTRIHITGYEHIEKDKTYIFIGNHRSIFDILVSYKLFPTITSFIAKKEIKKVPVLSWWMMLLHDLFLDRDDIKQGMQIILKAIDYAKSGINICVFPEGTRNRGEEPLLPFHAATFKIADKSGCPIIPMTMYNMSAVFEDHFPSIKRADVYIDFGEPIYAKDLAPEDRKRLSEYVRDIMLVKYEELKSEHEKSNVK